MIFKIVGIRDRAIDAFGTPFFVTAIGHAMRSFSNEINRTGSEFNLNPEDYDLYELGEYESDTGTVYSQVEHPKMIAIGKDYLKVNKE